MPQCGRVRPSIPTSQRPLSKTCARWPHVNDRRFMSTPSPRSARPPHSSPSAAASSAESGRSRRRRENAACEGGCCLSIVWVKDAVRTYLGEGRPSPSEGEGSRSTALMAIRTWTMVPNCRAIGRETRRPRLRRLQTSRLPTTTINLALGPMLVASRWRIPTTSGGSTVPSSTGEYSDGPPEGANLPPDGVTLQVRQ